MITFNNIVTKFQEFCDNHFFIETFSYGSPADVDLSKFERYPLLHLVYTGGDFNTPRTKTYNLEVYILSVPPAEADKVGYQKESISDAEQVAEDILADIQNGGNIFQFGYHYDLVNASVTPLEEEKSNALAGCLLDLAISVPYSYDSCNAPLEGVEPEGSGYPSFKARGLLRVREEDGTPDVLSVATINVPDGSLTDNGDGEITLAFGAADGTRLVQTVKNVSGVELTKGTPVHAVVDGAEGNLAYVIAARADTPSAMPATFVLNETLADEAEGEAIITGLIQGVATDAFTAGDVLYVGETGGYTNVKPTGTNLIQNLGIVLKSHASNGSGIVYGAGRSNDVPNLADGHFFIGSATNTQESTYGLPTSDPTDGETLVYSSSSDAFVGGYPTSNGQQSTFTAAYTSSTPLTWTTTGGLETEFGTYLSGDLAITQALRAGFSMGLNNFGEEFLAQPLSVGTTFTISYTVDVYAPTGTLGSFGLVGTGFFPSAGALNTIIGNDAWTTHTHTTTTQTVSFWQLANTLVLQANIVINPGTIQYKNQSLTITIDHA
jgi:hypothetical protein